MSKKNTWPYPPNLRDTEIENALKEIYASSEDDSDDGGTVHENYTMPLINEALDDLQGLTRSELLDILEKERVCSPPVPDQIPSFSVNEESANHRPVEQLASHSTLELPQEVVQQTSSSTPELETLQQLIEKNRVWSPDTSNFAAPDFKNKLKCNKVYFY